MKYVAYGRFVRQELPTFSLRDTLTEIMSRTLKITERLSIDVTCFRSKIYFHLRDNKKNKNFSLENVDMYELLRHRNELVKICCQLNRATRISKEPRNAKKVSGGKIRRKATTDEESRIGDESYGDMSSSDESDTM